MKKDFIMPILVLAVICIVVSGALAFVNNLTLPVISDAANERAINARRSIIPQAEGFELLTVEGLPKRILEVYKATHNTGFIFTISTHGYSPEDIVMICGISPDGLVIKTAVLYQNETQGLGTPIFEEAHAGQYWGRDRNGIEGVAAISGATITSNALKNGIRDAFTAFEIVKSYLDLIEEEE